MKDRYSRQRLFNKIGEHGQKQIGRKHVLVVGAGALGSASAEALVRAGVGKLTLIDRDYVEWSNLQRQQLYSERDAEEQTPKAMAAKRRLEQINSDVHLQAWVADATMDLLEPLFPELDVVIDATDNFDIRFILNDLSQKYRVPWIYGSCVGSYGASFTILPGQTPCLNCLLKQIPIGGATCDTVGIISPAVQVVASHQIAEAMKILVGDEAALRNSYLSFDLWNNQYNSFKVDRMKDNECPSCGLAPTYPYLSYENQTKMEVLCGRDTVQIRPASLKQYDFKQLESQLQQHGKVKRNPYLLSCQLENDYRLVVFKDGRSFIHGTKNIQEAKSIYYRLLG
ncbi:adenylyltransferase/sulfurtransferase [Pullulanibacillus pueri]|uniref:Thiamine/molybdopterin biosynthesis protein MoeB n=1 Tax=Pullulanibacillus pueri TaxID=1437324 RepID=A0A8J3END5_9BACL|nr:MoeB/ThiF family adenylyltransferase [Pullulanibacillus pueri]MBM7681010.1 adenylyltransferase/sulfurtransferase [Pullulanibacillus pueri]GGH86290.1 thiamine/molybdopterin biosynthesis protein MoeB [Pullulanibacillus pueri]